jgi:hypothetical protein
MTPEDQPGDIHHTCQNIGPPLIFTVRKSRNIFFNWTCNLVLRIIPHNHRRICFKDAKTSDPSFLSSSTWEKISPYIRADTMSANLQTPVHILSSRFTCPDDGGDNVPPKRRFLPKIHGARSQKTVSCNSTFVCGIILSIHYTEQCTPASNTNNIYFLQQEIYVEWSGKAVRHSEHFFPRSNPCK